MAKDRSITYKFLADIRDLIKGFSNVEKISDKTFNGIKKDANSIGKDLGKAFSTLKITSFSKIKKDIEDVRRAYDTLRTSGKLSAKELALAERSATQEIKKMKTEMLGLDETTKKNIENFRRWGKIIGTAVASFTVVKSTKEFADFDQAMREVGTVANATESQIKKMSDEILNLSTRLPGSAEELARAEYQAISYGVSMENAGKVVELASKAATGGVTDIDTAMKTGLGVMNAYGKSTKDLQNIYDKLLLVVQKGATNFEELSQYIGQVTSVSAGAGVSVDELGASMALMTKKGVKLPRAVTGFRQVLLNLISPADNVKKIMEENGIVWEGLIPTLKKLKAKGFDTVEALGKLGVPKESINSFQILINNVDELSNTVGEFKKSGGTLNQFYETIAKGLSNQIKLLKDNFTALAISIGKDLAPVIIPLIKSLADFLKLLTKLSPETRRVIEVIAGLVAGFVALKTAISGIKTAKALLSIATMTTGIESATESLGLFQKAYAGFKALLSAPLPTAGIVAGVGIIVAEIGLIAKAWWDAHKGIQEALNSISEDFNKTIKDTQKYANLRLKTDKEINNLSLKEAENYGKDLIQKRKNIQAKLGQLTKKQLQEADTWTGGIKMAFFGENIFDETEEEKKLKQQLSEIDNKIKSILDKKKGENLGAKISLPVEVTGIDKAQAELQKYYNGISQGVQNIIANKTGERIEQEKITKAIQDSKTAEEAYNKLLSDTKIRKKDLISKETLILNSLDIAIQKQNEYNNSVSGASDSFKQLKVNAGESIGFITNSLNEMFVTAGGETIKLNIDPSQIDTTMQAFAQMTEEQKAKWLEATQGIQVMVQGVDSLNQSLAGTNQNLQDIGTKAQKVVAPTPELGTAQAPTELQKTSKDVEQQKIQIQALIDNLNAQKDALKQSLDSVKQGFDTTITALQESTQAVLTSTQQYMSQSSTDWSNWATTIFQVISTTFKNINEITSQSVLNINDNFTSFLQTSATAINDWSTSVIASMQAQMDSFIAYTQGILSNANGLLSSLKQTLASIVLTNAKINTETKQKFAVGGKVVGASGIDKVPAMLTAGEYVIRKSIVDKLGVGFFHKLNAGLPFSMPQIPLHFATGGLVPPANGSPVVNLKNNTKVINLLDTKDILNVMSTEEGENLIINTILKNKKLL